MNQRTANLLQELRSLGSSQWKYERSVINLIASDNAYPRGMAENPTYRGHMIQEGLLGARPFAGAVLHDRLEGLAEEVACEVFHAEHANLQPHSCSQANQAVYHALVEPSEAVLALGFRSGGHLTHGISANFSGRCYSFSFYGTGADGCIDYASCYERAKTIRPRLIVCGSSSYPRVFDAQCLRDIADDVGAFLMFDLSHEAGLIAGGVLDNPVPTADVATMSLDKTLRGPFGGMVLCRRELAGRIDRGIHPGTQSSFPIRKLADAAHALILTGTDSFREYARAVVRNAKALEYEFARSAVPMVTGGTDKHYLVLNTKQGFSLSGAEAEHRLERIGILSSRQTIPQDTTSQSSDAGGLRLGTAWATSRGYDARDFQEIASIILCALRGSGGEGNQKELSEQVACLVRNERPRDVWRESTDWSTEAV